MCKIKCKWMLLFSFRRHRFESKSVGLDANDAFEYQARINWRVDGPHFHFLSRFSSFLFHFIVCATRFIWQLVFNGRLNNDVQY